MKLSDLNLTTVVHSIKSKEFTAEEYCKALIAQVESHSDLNCFIHFDAEALLSDVQARDRTDSSLAGVPIAIKDMLLTKGVTTTAGSRMLQNFVPPYSASVVDKLNAAGAVSAGKTNLDEFAMGSSNEHSAFGPVLNPWDTTRVSGGSSGGSAAAVAARLVPAALGTDTGGSVRQPAAFCGVVGLKPTYGRVSRYGVIAFASSLDQVGVFTRTVEDCALVYQTIAGWDPRDATSVNREVETAFPIEDIDVSTLTIGLPKQYYSEGIEPDVKTSVLEVKDKLVAEGAKVVDVDLPHTDAAIAAYYVIAPAEAASNLSRYDGVRYGLHAEGAESLEELYKKTRSEGFGPEVKRRILIGTYVLSKGYYDAYYRKAQRVRRLIANDFKEAYKQCDVLLAPATPSTAFTLGACDADPLQMYLNDVYTVPVNLAGLPAMSVPCGLDNKNLPIGLQLIAPPWHEAHLLQIAARIEQLVQTTFNPLEAAS